MYTTAAKVRALLPTLLVDDDDLGVSSSGTNLTLTFPAFDVPTILIDGVSSTAFTFERPDKITLDAEATGQRFIAQVYRGIDDSAIEALILASDRQILAEFNGYDMPASGYLEDWSGLLTVSRYLRLYASANEENLDKAEGLEKIVSDDIDAFKVDVSSDSDHILIKVNG
ncbi:hypothetical protein KAR91_80505 [Candidatus Pacearchaeota archaeon]|nr:hypothetical protein [Candidatus Pacearchaeota archaeon]